MLASDVLAHRPGHPASRHQERSAHSIATIYDQAEAYARNPDFIDHASHLLLVGCDARSAAPRPALIGECSLPAGQSEARVPGCTR
jgi:hypothetical protein